MPAKLVEWICRLPKWGNGRRNRFGGRSQVCFEHVRLELLVDF